MRRVCIFIGGGILAAIFLAGIVAYFISSFDPATRQWYDGLGRPLSDSPWFMRLIFGQERQWAGWFWFAADMVVFWGGGALGVTLIDFGRTDRDRELR